jgi:hypothetical protein
MIAPGGIRRVVTRAADAVSRQMSTEAGVVWDTA